MWRSRCSFKCQSYLHTKNIHLVSHSAYLFDVDFVCKKKKIRKDRLAGNEPWRRNFSDPFAKYLVSWIKKKSTKSEFLSSFATWSFRGSSSHFLSRFISSCVHIRTLISADQKWLIKPRKCMNDKKTLKEKYTKKKILRQHTHTHTHLFTHTKTFLWLSYVCSSHTFFFILPPLKKEIWIFPFLLFFPLE